MISPEKIEEWIKEAEERPSSAAPILRIISNRLSELAARNEELLEENIALRSEKKVEEYESKIANLEYQLDLLKRQLGGHAMVEPALAEGVDTKLSLVLYNPQGFILRTEFDPAALSNGGLLGSYDPDALPDVPRMLVTHSQEELLLAFSSGRTVAVPVSSLPSCSPDDLSWDAAFFQEPVGLEELSFIQPIGRMALSELCITASRKGYVKKAKETFFESYVTKNYIGTGTKLPVDKAINLIFCQSNDLYVMASQEGYLLSLPVSLLSLNIEETFKLANTDHVVSAFAMAQKPSVLVVTNNGKAVIRESGWLAPADALKSRGQAVFSKDRREQGVRIAGAAAVSEKDWGLALTASGKLLAYRVSDLISSGALGTGDDRVIEFETFAEA